jgi:hypothetical protein
MPRRREPAPSVAEGLELCSMCGEHVLVGADGRCELGHRVRQPVADLWLEEHDLAEAAAATIPIAAVGLDEPLPEGELRDALAGPLDLDADEAATVELTPGSDEDLPADPEEAADADDPDEPPRPATDLGGELDW